MSLDCAWLVIQRDCQADGIVAAGQPLTLHYLIDTALAVPTNDEAKAAGRRLNFARWTILNSSGHWPVAQSFAFRSTAQALAQP